MSPDSSASAHQLAYEQRLEAVVDYIEGHLNEDLSLARLADVAHFSSFHFHRVFRARFGQTVHEHVAQARLARAIALMRSAPAKPLSDIAAESGFGSLSDFSRVFARSLGRPASSVRTTAALDQLLRSRRGGVASNAVRPSATVTQSVHIETLPAQALVVARVRGGYLDPESLVQGYKRLVSWAAEHDIDPGTPVLGMSIDDPDVVPLARCRYDFAVLSAARPSRSTGLHRRTLPALTWAVTHCVGGMNEVVHAWDTLFRHWLPQSGYQSAAAPAMERYRQRPEVIGWDRFDLDCCLPIEPL